MSIKQIGKQIQKRRKILQINQADLAEISGVSLRTIKAIEAGDANPTVDILARVLKPLGLTVAAHAAERA
jgi:transcriptional regulator with XRE-family HTH domain